MYWGWKSGQEPDEPAFERNPSELPKTHFVEKGREHSSWYSFWGPEHVGRHPCDKSLTPWSGPEWANHPSSTRMPWNPKRARAASMHFVNVLGAKGKNLVLVSLPSKSEPKELPVPLNFLNMKTGIFQIDSDKPLSVSNLPSLFGTRK